MVLVAPFSNPPKFRWVQGTPQLPLNSIFHSSRDLDYQAWPKWRADSVTVCVLGAEADQRTPWTGECHPDQGPQAGRQPALSGCRRAVSWSWALKTCLGQGGP